MIERLRSESGFTLIELLLAMSLMLVVMGATLNTLDNGGRNQRVNADRNDAVEQARSSIDTIVRQLRNLASPSAATPNAIDRATATDFAFRTFDPNKRIVRYCLQTPVGSPTPVTGVATNLIQMLSNLSAAGSYADCNLQSTTGWSSKKIVARNIVNQRVSTNASDIFSYNGSPITNTSTVTNVRILLRVDINSQTKAPDEVRLASGAALRNQNQAPTAKFVVTTPTPGPGNRRFLLNAAGSFDPENHNLIFTWYLGHGTNYTLDSSTFVGNGPTVDYTIPQNRGAGTDYYFTLVVSDSNLTDRCPSSTGTTTNCSTAGAITIT